MAGQITRITITLIVVVVAVLCGRWIWDHYLYSPWTRDGRVRANIITIAPDVSGWVKQLNVADNARVTQGQLLFAVDDTRYQAALAELQAQLHSREIALELAKHRYERRKKLTKTELISDEDLETARINTESAKADYALAEAELNTAKINLERTQIVAPESGNIINLTLRQGNYVHQGTAVLSLVQQDSFYVTGYFEETKLPLIHVGQTAKISLMSGGPTLSGRVESIGKAIADTNTSSNGQLLPQVQQTFNWVRLAQRIPVDIKLDPLPENVSISAGMTASIHLQE
ncbi:HlyD family secretion protein [Shewanella sp. C32]|uniref:HlyD family secretion protein n=1 Tax=Shewanella electrica TaxID=515560 RepID=A0ABT2FIQ1_9GAMM|nr:HlyD family secretion protein [Shewanella electrica]MCH1924302.1 HlyD family secretion protein [Shewanella electrica]MCS4556205.1 HlyD family secretion protein [Shewanella electrica]